MAHTVWSGAISFGLVNIPVKAKVATRDRSIRFVQLHEQDGERIRMQRTCPEHGPIPYEEVTKGHPVGKSEFVVVTKDEISALEPEKADTIEIEAFVKLEEVDPVYFDKTYHLVAEAAGGKAYQLLVDALEDTGRVAIGRFVMRNKEHLVALRTWEGHIVMETLYFHDEVVPPDEVTEEAKLRAPSKKEEEMAVKLIETLATEFDPLEYEDTFRNRLLELIEAKAQGSTVQVKERPREVVIEDLEAALEKSLQEIKR